MGNPIKDFFDSKAHTWDEGDHHCDEAVDSLLSGFPIKKGERVLDLACGTGVITGRLHALTQNDVVGVDLSDKMINVAKLKYQREPWAHFLAGDFLEMENLGQFDWVVLYNAYPHFLEPEHLAEKVASVLKDGGHFLLLHSLGRAALNHHHEGMQATLCRDLLPVDEEAIYFKKHFLIEQFKDEKDCYFLLGRKK